MIKLIVWGIVIYLIYKFVFELLVPVTKATSQMKDKIQEMQEQQQKNATATEGTAKHPEKRQAPG
jgi:hypothetical protein